MKLNLHPLQNRIKKAPVPEPTSLLKAVSIVWPVLVYNVISQVVLIVFAYFMQWISLENGNMLPLAEWVRAHSVLISGVVKALSLAAGAVAVWHYFVKETPVIAMPKGRKKDIGILVILGGCAALAVNILFSLIGFTGSSEVYEQVAEKQFALPLWAGIILYGIVSPIAEEIVFRGIVYNRMHRQYGKWIAIISSALLFGLYHGNIVQALYGFILGLLIAVLYEKYASFAVPVIIHSAANVFVYVVTSVTGVADMVMTWPVMLICILLSGGLLGACLRKTE
ncbi:MAG: CPBP family intramembrane metalloprotease [Lachnospiraceae bacterium]|nr:CPBP family intramembrane metalloprotease [Lachnospiraceae bacterium]